MYLVLHRRLWRTSDFGIANEKRDQKKWGETRVKYFTTAVKYFILCVLPRDLNIGRASERIIRLHLL